MSDNELGAFLRARREALTPAEAGLPAGMRRRTPGLRRSELAMLAGISVEYLTRLEQGRDRNPSAQVLGALSDALRLPLDARVHMRRLMKTQDHHLCAMAPAPAREVRSTVRALLDRLGATPAAVTNVLGEIVAYSDGYARIARPVGLLDGDPPSLPRYVFTDPRAREVYPDWDRVADQQVAGLYFGITGSDPAMAELARELTITAGAAFSDRLTASGVLPERSGVERLVHPEAGELRLAYEVLELAEADGQQLVVRLPADEASSAALDRLVGRRPGTLRAVGG
ncbi:helix-turn-helix domain-containing protein [Streptomyces sp. P9(2023)]|uniref:helix-turn-helix domain-containing protein n=1 Tax=Streptomyces sp. P9(2023) TaxID=3064394 RepID=UPI0028F415F9|nr:helix-turn-helix domain-containing protein [Streptomyces sp. P9(2023)]MDT9693661.1 helix-turn-helix domain-containing protein [Streptomyces sp. P9(2023)]